ncbi:MAG: Ig-like domain-containing protein, partial [Marmoricola sp.]
YAQTNDGQLTPYTSWSDFGQHLKHPESLINFVAAYGKHPTILNATTLVAKRDAARAIVDPSPGNPTATPPIPADVPPADAAEFIFSTGAWSSDVNGVTNTGLDDVDLWVGGLAEVTNLFGGLLGSTFNYVFQGQLEDLQDGDRLYYLNRTPGMNLRTQLEGNSFAELIQRNTDNTNTLKADAFGTADCKFQLANLNGTAAGFATFGSTVADDPTTTDCDESKLLLRQPDGTIQYRAINSVNPTGINSQSVYNGTPGTDRVFGGNDNDTFWGSASRDFIEGNGGDDVALGGDGNDIMTDLGGADVTKGGPGNDAIDSGPGNDISMGGDGQDFMNGGANDNETFAGPGNDFVIAGQGADAVFGGGGDDWIQGGTGQDLLQGDHGAPFFDDPAETAPGNDIMIGQPGENDYDAEGGDDIMSSNAAIDRFAGAGGFDWAIHQYDTVPANDDMMINNNLVGVPIQVVVNRDRWQETEADSGGPLNDVIKGTSGALATPRLVGGAGFTGCDAIDQAGLDRITGLSDLLPPVSQWVGNAADVAALSASGVCPLTGPVWGEGDILLGGPGNDSLEGRAGNDVINGDKSLQVAISVRTNPADPATEIGRTDLMEHQATRGNFVPNTVGKTLQQAVFAGIVDPGNLVAVREIVGQEPGDAASVDTAVFTGPRGQYNITVGNQQVTVTDTVGTDGVDTLTGIEKLQFSDGTVDAPLAPSQPTIGTAVAADGAALVQWTAGAANGADPTGGYRIQVLQGGLVQRTVTGIAPTATSATVDGLTNGTAYTFRVIAVNPAGISAPSAESNAVTPVAGPPRVVLSSPLNGATGVPVGSNVTVTFNKPVTGLTVTTARLRNTATGAGISEAVSYDAPNRTLTVDPTANLAPGTSYTLTLLAGTGTTGIKDAAGVRIVTKTIQFTTATDTIAPVVISSLPPNNGLGVGVAANVNATFSERVVGTDIGTVVLRNQATGVQFPGVVTLNATGRVVTFNPTGNLLHNTVYELTLTGCRLPAVWDHLVATSMGPPGGVGEHHRASLWVSTLARWLSGSRCL